MLTTDNDYSLASFDIIRVINDKTHLEASDWNTFVFCEYKSSLSFLTSVLMLNLHIPACSKFTITYSNPVHIIII